MTDAEFLIQIKIACLRFRAKYGLLPEKIGILYSRRLPFEWGDRIWFYLPTPLTQEIAKDVTAVAAFTHEFVKFEPFAGIGQYDFRLYAEVVGIVAPDELEGIELSPRETQINNLWQ